MSGFRRIPKPQSQGVRSGKRYGSPREYDLVYDLDYDDARQWHQTACEGDSCWCGDLAGVPFLETLMVDVLEPAGFTAAGSFVPRLRPDSIVLRSGPGVDSEDDTPIRQAVSDST